MNEKTELSFADLIKTATTTPGIVSSAFRMFHNYSIGNQLLAAWQMSIRGITPGPIASYNTWRERGRFVRKGEKAIALCMPVTHKRTVKVKEGGETVEKDVTFSRFILRNNWFALSQTDGAEYTPEPLPTWEKSRALATLGILEKPFDMVDGNVQGYAIKNEVAINPVAEHPWQTLFHEIAHILLGHTAETVYSDTRDVPRDEREMEAECVAMLVSSALELGGADESRGYIQSWYGMGREITEKSAQRIMKTADKILRAGRDEVIT